MRHAAMVFALVLASQSEGPAPPKEAELGKAFELRPGQVAVVVPVGLKVGVHAVTQDSRCPIGVQCVWEGDAVVEVTLEKPAAAKTTRVLHTNGRYERETEYEGLKIRLRDVTPYPKEGVTVIPKDYRVTLVVEKR